jgi:Protein of unknown function (DUF5672)
MKLQQRIIIIFLVFLNAAISIYFVYQAIWENGTGSTAYDANYGEKHQKLKEEYRHEVKENLNEQKQDDIKLILKEDKQDDTLNNEEKEKQEAIKLNEEEQEEIVENVASPVVLPSCICGSGENMTQRQFCMSSGNITELESLTDGEAANFYTRMMMAIQKPKSPNFVVADENTQLEIVLMEMKPSESKFLVPAIYNIANIYANETVAFTVVHHAFHSPVLNALKPDFKNLRLIQLAEGEFSINQYSMLLSSPKLWNNFKSKFTLITQTDVLIIKPLTTEFYQYDLIGAPWVHKPCDSKDQEHQVGNGGYTLRNTTKMKEIIEKEQNADGQVPEDVWWCERVANVPHIEFAKQFSVEMFEIYDILPTAGHKMWAYRGTFNSGGHFFREFQKVNNITVC